MICKLKEENKSLKDHTGRKPFLDIVDKKAKQKRINNVMKTLKTEFAATSPDSPISEQGTEHSTKASLIVLDVKDNIAAGLSKLLDKNPEIFNQLIKNRKKGKWIEKFEKDCFGGLSEAITPALALAIKIRLKMSDRKYELLRSILRKKYDHEKSKFVPREIKPGKKFPNLFPPLKHVRRCQDSLRSLNPEQTTSGYRQSMKELILKILKMPEFRSLLAIKDNTLKLKVGCDGFKLTRYQCK